MREVFYLQGMKYTLVKKSKCYRTCTPERAQGELGDTASSLVFVHTLSFLFEGISDGLVRVRATNQADDMRFVIMRARKSEIS